LAALAGFGWTVPREAEAGFYQDGTTSQQTLDFGAAYQGDALSFRIRVPGVGTGERNTSATFLNSGFALTVAHNITDLLQFNPTYEVADGSNFLTDRGNVMMISNIIFHPSLDLAILQFSQPFNVGEDKVIGSAITGDITYSAGFGQWGTPSIGLVSPRDGGLRAWDGRVLADAIGGPAPFYQSTGFGIDNIGLSLNGRAAFGDSGGPVFNSVGELIGLNYSASSSMGPLGSTTYVRLGEPSSKAWIESNASVPEPSALTYGLLGAAGLLSRRQRRGCSRSFPS
jgi:hypothetical protein